MPALKQAWQRGNQANVDQFWITTDSPCAVWWMLYKYMPFNQVLTTLKFVALAFVEDKKGEKNRTAEGRLATRIPFPSELSLADKPAASTLQP
jgi:hypothetical protein